MGPYAIGGQRPPDLARIVVVAAVFTFLLSLEGACAAPGYFRGQVTDECDWTGSGLDNEQQTYLGVQPVYLRCKEGIIVWKYPRGALRIVLRMGQSNKDFIGCLKVDTNSTGASIYLEGHQKLQKLHVGAEDNSVDNGDKCFKSKGGQVALFLEAQPTSDGLNKAMIRFMYDLQPVKQNPFSECRPCTEREMLFLFCTSDFVVRGTISSINQNVRAQQTELTVRAVEVIRDSDLRVFNQGTKTDTGILATYGILHRPLHCGTRAGSGEYLFLGRWRLGNPVISCAPRWIEWKKVRQKALSQLDNIDCMLE